LNIRAEPSINGTRLFVATHGRGRLYSSLAQRPLNNVSFMTVTLIDVQARRSHPLQGEQREPVVPSEESIEPPPKRPRGRPKGSKNHRKSVPQLTPDWTLLQRMIAAITARIAPDDQTSRAGWPFRQLPGTLCRA
jgi:hypothetical protein